MKKKLVTLTLMMFSLNVFSQTSDDNLRRYWHYRYRLVNYFMTIGNDKGESIPADIRNFFVDENVFDRGLHWGDATLHLGWYIGVLATEYRLLHNNGQSTNRTLYELYYALHALIRLDKEAESPEDYNGLLLRDDVPSDFITTHFSLINYDPNNGTINSSQTETYGYGTPGFVNTVVSSGTSTDESFKYFSGDHMCHILLGLALAKNCLDGGVLSFSGIDPQTGIQQNISADLKQLSIEIADKIVSYLKDGGSNAWILSDPDGNDISNGEGGNCRTYATAFAKAGTYITGNDYSDIHTSTQIVWQLAQSLKVFRCNSDNLHMALALADISDSWKDDDGNNTTEEGIKYQGDYDGGIAPLSLLTLPFAFVLTYQNNHNGWDVFNGAAHKVLHGKNNISSDDMCKIKYIIDHAPDSGPYFHHFTINNVGIDDIPPFGWGSPYRWVASPPEQSFGTIPNWGEYNGLDYMLMYNLYYLLNSQSVTVSGSYPLHTSIFNVDNYLFTTDNPGVVITPLKIYIQNLSISEIDGHLGDIIVTGGSPGVFIKATHVHNGGELHVSVHPTCTIDPSTYIFNQSDYLRIANPNSSNESDNNYEMTQEFRQQALVNSISNSPNPSSGLTIINYTIRNSGPVKIILNDLIGKQLAKIIDLEKQEAGFYSIPIDITDLKAGIYFFNLSGNDFSVTNKIIITK